MTATDVPPHDSPIEVAGDLYREIAARGLHLRTGNGRDDALYDELKNALGCSVGGLQTFLDSSHIPAERLLTEFLKLAAPFAAMYQEIWAYLGEHLAPEARESLRIRFGFENQVDMDLDQFRESVVRAERVLTVVQTEVWTEVVLGALYPVAVEAMGASGVDRYSRGSGPGYVPGEPYEVPTVRGASGHPFEADARRVRDVFQAVVDRATESKRRSQDLQSAERPALDRATIWMTDLLPAWTYVFENLDQFTVGGKDAGHRAFETGVVPLLEQREAEREVLARELIDVLNLPFWQHRWHTYEVWATILTLRALVDYTPSLCVEDGYVPIDRTTASMVARLNARGHPEACVAVQVQTPFVLGDRKAIKPDLRICFGDPLSGGETAGVVEYKQRLGNERSHLEEVARAYSGGCAASGGVVIVNYDASGVVPSLPEDTTYVEEVRPGEPAAIGRFGEALREVLIRASLLPERASAVVLFDVSGSMTGAYDSDAVRVSVAALQEASHIEMHCFGYGLVSPAGFDANGVWRTQTSGGADLDAALRELRDGGDLPERALIVSDGGHGPDFLLRLFHESAFCSPDELSGKLDWLGILDL